MIGSGIFIVSAEMSREIGSPGWLLVAWAIAGLLTVAGAVCYGELSATMPEAGGMYLYLREAYSPVVGFLYGWTLFTVIQTGTIAAVSVAFARFSGVIWRAVSEERYIVLPLR
jgi:APA family basic amino acid/polyamine antiporter